MASYDGDNNLFILYLLGPIRKGPNTDEVMPPTTMMGIVKEVNIFHLLNRVIDANIPGEVVELGSHGGRTAAIMQLILDQANSSKELHLYDSFKGPPPLSLEDGINPFGEGPKITEGPISEERILTLFNMIGLKHPKIHGGWFKDTLPIQLPDKIAFAHFDSNFYTSIKDSLTYTYTKLSPGAIVVIDDYCVPELVPKIVERTNLTYYVAGSWQKITMNPGPPGIKQACDEFFDDKPERMYVLICGGGRQAYFKKQ